MFYSLLFAEVDLVVTFFFSPHDSLYNHNLFIQLLAFMKHMVDCDVLKVKP